jgi:hypothetical protein
MLGTDDLRVGNLMTSDPVVIGPDAPAGDTERLPIGVLRSLDLLRLLLRDRGIGSST